MMLDAGVQDGNVVGEELTTECCQSKATRELLTDKAKIERYDWSTIAANPVLHRFSQPTGDAGLKITLRIEHYKNPLEQLLPFGHPD